MGYPPKPPWSDFGSGPTSSMPTCSKGTSITGRVMEDAEAGLCGDIFWHWRHLWT